MTALTRDPERSAAEPASLFSPARRPETIALLRADPDLAARLPADEAVRATRVVRARWIELRPGAWRTACGLAARAVMGVLIVDGLVCRSVTVGTERSSEVLGAGDVLRPWAGDPSLTIEATVEYEVLAHTTAALLDRDFVRSIAPWPELSVELMDRALRRARALSVLNATTHIKRTDARLLALFWQLADRWGRVRPDGIVVPINLKHATLAALVGAQRPSVTTALGRMAARGVLTRTKAGEFLLGPSAQTEFEQLCLSPDARRFRRLLP